MNHFYVSNIQLSYSSFWWRISLYITSALDVFLLFVCSFIVRRSIHPKLFGTYASRGLHFFSVRDLNLEVHGTNRFEVFGVCSVHAVACALGLVQGLVQSWFLY